MFELKGFMPDLRSHPAINFYRSGLPIVIAGDDPGSFGYNELTVDYYMAFMAWGLNLADLKVIANNSLIYSTVPDEVKTEGFIKFNREWTSYIDMMYAKACQDNYNQSGMVFNELLPDYGK